MRMIIINRYTSKVRKAYMYYYVAAPLFQTFGFGPIPMMCLWFNVTVALVFIPYYFEDLECSLKRNFKRASYFDPITKSIFRALNDSKYLMFPQLLM